MSAKRQHLHESCLYSAMSVPEEATHFLVHDVPGINTSSDESNETTEKRT